MPAIVARARDSAPSSWPADRQITAKDLSVHRCEDIESSPNSGPTIGCRHLSVDRPLRDNSRPTKGDQNTRHFRVGNSQYGSDDGETGEHDDHQGENGAQPQHQ